MTLLAALASAWVALVLLAPWLPVPVAGVVYVLGGRLCHQIAERSFFLAGAQLPVCARCLGIYAGGAVGLLLPLLPGLRHMACGAPRDHATVRGVIDVRVAILIAAAINVLTLWSASNPVRAVAGLVLGIAVALAIGTVDYGRWRRPQRSRSAPPQLPT